MKISKSFVRGAELDLLLLAVTVSLLRSGRGGISMEWDDHKGNNSSWQETSS
ncbi:MAG: hypothetical protein V3T40_00050 [Nitrososphaerales archaeon]